MKKKYKVIGLDCAHCASRLEAAIKKVEGVNEAKVNFLTQKVTLDIEENNIEKICEDILKVAKKTIPDCKLEG